MPVYATSVTNLLRNYGVITEYDGAAPVKMKIIGIEYWIVSFRNGTRLLNWITEDLGRAIFICSGLRR